MNEAIKLAIENGWGKNQYPDFETFKTNEQILFDPLFWQSLGKALGWQILEEDYKLETGLVDVWLDNALCFFELKLTGGDEETFWKELIK